MRTKIFGPPGTGKTTALINAVVLAKSHLANNQIALLSFTRAGREEALQRLGGVESDWEYVRTLHSLCYRNLGTSGSRMVSRNDYSSFSKLVGVEIKEDGQIEDDEPWTALPIGDQLLRANHLGRHKKLHLRDTLAYLRLDVDEKLAEHFTNTYREWKKTEGIYDYTDLLTRYLQHGKPLPVKLFIVDEAQDLSPLQWDVVEKMGSKAADFIVAGDDDQAIYSWAGATADQFNNWPADEIKILHQSWRLPRNVMDLSRGITEQIESRTIKETKPTAYSGSVEHVFEFPYIEQAHGSVLVLYRYAQRGRQLAKLLRAQRVPYGGSFSPIVKATKALEYVMVQERGSPWNQDQWKAYHDLVADSNKKPIAVRNLTRAWQADYLAACNEEFPVDQMLQPKIMLMSIHAAKGREADTVVVDTSMSRASFEHLQDDPDDEHRVWYVGVTRAKQNLIIFEGSGDYRYEL